MAADVNFIIAALDEKLAMLKACYGSKEEKPPARPMTHAEWKAFRESHNLRHKGPRRRRRPLAPSMEGGAENG